MFSPVERLSNPKLWILTKKEHSSPKLRVTSILFRLNEEQNIRFNDLLCKAGLEHNRSRFIVKRIFGEEFVVVRRDPSKVQFIARLNDFYFQFQKLGNNCVPSRRYNKYSDGKLLGKCSLKITYHQPTYLKGKPDRECSMSG